MNVYLYPSNTETELKNAYIWEYYHIQTFDFQNNWLQDWTLNNTWNSDITMSLVSWQWIKVTVASWANWWWHIIPPQSVYKWTLKRIRLWAYLSSNQRIAGVTRIKEWSWWIVLRYRHGSWDNYIWFWDGWSWTANIWNYTWEILIDMNFETWKVSGTCAWQSYTITSSSADDIITYWANKKLCLTWWAWWWWDMYVRKVEIESAW